MPRTRPQIRPPTLRTGEEATASRLELFFDLAYVLVVLELANAFYADLSWRGFVVFVALYVAMWFSWVGFTLYANRFDTEDVVFRLAKLAATASIAGCAASASAATGEFSTPFALCFLTGRVILLLLHLRAWRHVPEARPTIGVYLGHHGQHRALGPDPRWHASHLARGVAVADGGDPGRGGRRSGSAPERAAAGRRARRADGGAHGLWRAAGRPGAVASDRWSSTTRGARSCCPARSGGSSASSRR